MTLDLAPVEVERIAEASPELLAALRLARQERWTTETELLAGIYEVSHATYRATLAAGGVKPNDLPAEVHVPRPNEKKKKRKPAATGVEFRRWVTQRRGGNK